MLCSAFWRDRPQLKQCLARVSDGNLMRWAALGSQASRALWEDLCNLAAGHSDIPQVLLAIMPLGAPLPPHPRQCYGKGYAGGTVISREDAR